MLPESYRFRTNWRGQVILQRWRGFRAKMGVYTASARDWCDADKADIAIVEKWVEEKRRPEPPHQGSSAKKINITHNVTIDLDLKNMPAILQAVATKCMPTTELDYARRIDELLDANNALRARARKAEAALAEAGTGHEMQDIRRHQIDDAMAGFNSRPYTDGAI